MNLEVTIDDITPELLQEFINKDKGSKEKLFMQTCDKYFNVENETISSRRKVMVLVNDHGDNYAKDDLSKANYKVKHSYLQELINQCTNYIAGKPMTIDYKRAFEKVTMDLNGDGVVTPEERKSITGDTKADQDKEVIDNNLYRDNNFNDYLQENIKNLQLYGKSYMRIVVHNKLLKFVTYNPKEMIMFHNDFNEPVLAIRYFKKPELQTKTIDKVSTPKKEIKDVEYAEVFNTQFKDTWKFEKGKWEKIEERELVYSNKISYGNKTVTEIEPISIPVFPIIEWKFNSNEVPTLSNIKDFIDIQDLNLSDLANNVEDIQDAIWILENYTGQNLQEFMKDLKEKKAIKVGAGGTARSETIEIPVNAREKLYELSRKNIYKFGFGIDFQERDSLGNVTGVALKWSYAPLEQKANSIEMHGQEALNNFFNILFMLLGMEYESNDLEFIFDRTMIANEQEQTATIMSASHELSQRTILDNLPMVSDTDDELERLKEDNEYDPELPEEIVESGKEDEEETNEDNEDNIKHIDSKFIKK